MNDLTAQEHELIVSMFNNLLGKCEVLHNAENRALVQKAFDLAYQAHQSQRRKSGEPYIIHPVEVAKIAGEEMGLDYTSIACALLHDVVEDSNYTLDDIENQFNRTIRETIDGLTKITDVYDSKSNIQAENFKKMLLTIPDNTRVILLKIADRLHNMRTIEPMSLKSKQKNSAETLHIYAPIAHRMGFYKIKRELEDLAFCYTSPREYTKLLLQITESEENRRIEFDKLLVSIEDRLKQENIVFELRRTHKSTYSAWKKMNEQELTFDEVYNYTALQIIFSPEPHWSIRQQCFNIYAIITGMYPSKPDMFRDWVNQPRANDYEAVHGVIVSPAGKFVEIHILSHQMLDVRERGYVMKLKIGAKPENSEIMKWIKKISSQLKKPKSNAVEFLEEFRSNLFSSDIYVYTPKGEIRVMPENSTVLDFAFEIHSDLGFHCSGARVNHHIRGNSYRLHSGDLVDIIYSEIQNPEHHWLDFVITAKAKAKLKAIFKIQQRGNLKKGTILLNKLFDELHIDFSNAEIKKTFFKELNLENEDELFCNFGGGIIMREDIERIFKKYKDAQSWFARLSSIFGKSHSVKNGKPKAEPKVVKNEDAEHPEFALASCCQPLPGDDVISIKQNNICVIHKANCPIAIRLKAEQGDLLLGVDWQPQRLEEFVAGVEIRGFDRHAIISDITDLLSKNLHVNINSINFKTKEGTFFGQMDIFVHSLDELNAIIAKIKKIDNIQSVVRNEKYRSPNDMGKDNA